MELMLPSSQSTTGWLLLEQGGLAGRRYCFETSICPSPVCQCERVTPRCSPELAPQASVPVCLEMDLAQREIANFKKLKSDPASITVAKAPSSIAAIVSPRPKPEDNPVAGTQTWSNRPLSLWQRQKVQKVLRRLTPKSS